MYGKDNSSKSATDVIGMVRSWPILAVAWRPLKLEGEHWRVASPAKQWRGLEWWRSFLNRRKRVETSAGTLRTSPFAENGSNRNPSTRMEMIRLLRKHDIYDTRAKWDTNEDKFNRKHSCQTRSKALEIELRKPKNIHLAGKPVFLFSKKTAKQSEETTDASVC